MTELRCHRISLRYRPALLFFRAAAILLGLLLLSPDVLFAQAGEPVAIPVTQTPLIWYVLATALALLVPAGVVLVGVADMSATRAWDAALGALAAIGVVTMGYWAFGFALQFGGVGLVYPDAELRDLVWEWSMLSSEWGIGWGMAGLSGWFLSGPGITTQAYTLFLGHLPWAITAALIPVIALRRRAQAIATIALAFLVGAFIYPLAGNWVQGGGWLNALGRNLSLGHGFVDFGGAGTVFLVSGAFTLAGLVVWSPRRRQLTDPADEALRPAQLPLLAVVGALLVMGGLLGWLWANPLQMSVLPPAAIMRGSVNLILAAGAGTVVPIVYTWFVSGYSHPTLSARGLMAGVVAALAAGPFVQPGGALFIGFLAGATVPFVAYLVDKLLGLDDRTGVVTATIIPAMLGLLLVGFFADGVFGRGWQMTGLDSYLGVTGQGVTGLMAADGFQPDFPGQLQAQLIGILSLTLWGFFTGLVICFPLGLLLHALQRDDRSARKRTPALADNPQASVEEARDATVGLAGNPESRTGDAQIR
jgi:Amt family ammonium transporter